ncbi:hypothetical protein KIW84_057187 [Lathyrus oleraceus]|uniref:Uncharacterized protein n=1 Tax=Pisum sativum TaxID=3888 RepID=A0A9D5AHT4_PEA|nr:hypothetical protein KIW84_057187 [Pisum sativum]
MDEGLNADDLLVISRYRRVECSWRLVPRGGNNHRVVIAENSSSEEEEPYKQEIVDWQIDVDKFFNVMGVLENKQVKMAEIRLKSTTVVWWIDLPFRGRDKRRGDKEMSTTTRDFNPTNKGTSNPSSVQQDLDNITYRGWDNVMVFTRGTHKISMAPVLHFDRNLEGGKSSFLVMTLRENEFDEADKKRIFPLIDEALYQEENLGSSSSKVDETTVGRLSKSSEFVLCPKIAF